MNIDQIQANKPVCATGYYENEVYIIRYLRKTSKNYFYLNTVGGMWWKVPITALRFISDNYKPL